MEVDVDKEDPIKGKIIKSISYNTLGFEIEFTDGTSLEGMTTTEDDMGIIEYFYYTHNKNK